MAGHSKWANIKHRKERADKKKGKIFSRIIKEIISATRQGGPDPKSNQKLRIAIQKAKEANVPNDNIERNIKKASSENGEAYTEMTYELYGFAGVGILAEVMTDNKNRISSDLRIATNKCGGTIAVPGAVSYNFERKGVLRIAKEDAKEETLFSLATESGAEDFLSQEDCFVIYTPVELFAQIKTVIDEQKIVVQEAGLEMVPKTHLAVSTDDFDRNMALIEWLENLDDVDCVFHNMTLQAPSI